MSFYRCSSIWFSIWCYDYEPQVSNAMLADAPLLATLSSGLGRQAWMYCPQHKMVAKKMLRMGAGLLVLASHLHKAHAFCSCSKCFKSHMSISS